MLFFITVSMLVMCKATKPLVTKKLPDSTANIAPPTIEVESVSLDKPITISFAGKDTVKKIELTVTTPIKTVFDTTAFNDYVTKYFTDFKNNFYSTDEEVRKHEQTALVGRIESLLGLINSRAIREKILRDSIINLNNRNRISTKLVEKTENALFDFAPTISILMLIIVLVLFFSYRCLKYMRR